MNENKKNIIKINLKTSKLLIKNYINIIINLNTIFLFKTQYKTLKKKTKKNLVLIRLNKKFKRETKVKNTKYQQRKIKKNNLTA